MTFEEMQQIIQEMLAVQRQIQESQLKHEERAARHDEQVAKHEERAARHDEQVAKHEERAARHDEQIAIIDERLAKITERMGNLTENVENLSIISQRHENRLTYLYGYDMQAESNLLDIRQRMLNLDRRIAKIEQNYFNN